MYPHRRGAETPDWVQDILDQLLAQLLEDQSPAMTQVIGTPRETQI
jgi:hypothetical protein